jgi:5-methylcytosine-specific restriction endonuclease McrA
MARLEIEHIIPVSKGGSSEESNLWLACPICNSHKAGKIEAIDPVTDEVVALFDPSLGGLFELKQHSTHLID